MNNAEFSFARRLLVGGLSALRAMVDEKQEETLHLEFKTLSAASNANLSKDDRKLLAKAICGAANAEGGTIIVGIRTIKDDGLDVASALQPISNYVRIRNQTSAALSEMLSPQHAQITVEAIADGSDASAGYLIIDVPPSDRRPHMSLKEHRYFRRGSDGTRVLEHGEVRDLMMANRESVVEIGCNIRTGPSSGDLRFGLSLVLTLKNVGRVPARAPYIRISEGGWHNAASVEGLSRRTSADGSFGIYASRDVLVHLDDEIALAEHPTGLDFRLTGQYHLPHAVAAIKQGQQWQHFRMLPWSDMPSEGYTSNDRPINVNGFFGAENAAVKPFRFAVDKISLLEMFGKKMSLS
jgi:hypothetical protein